VVDNRRNVLSHTSTCEGVDKAPKAMLSPDEAFARGGVSR
jgi:hypothetical protein